MQTTLTSKHGLGQAAKELNQLGRKMLDINLDKPMDKVFRRSKELCPVGMTGNLRASGRLDKTKSGKTVSYIIHYNTAYASFVHELDFDVEGAVIHHGQEFNDYWAKFIENPRDFTFQKNGNLVTIPAAYFHKKSPEETAHFIDQAFEEYEPSVFERAKSWMNSLIDKVLR